MVGVGCPAMNILAVVMDPAPQSPRPYMVRVAEQWARDGHTVHIANLRSMKDMAWPVNDLADIEGAVTFHPYKVNQRPPRWLSERLPKEGVDVAFTSSISGAPILQQWKRDTGLPTVCQVLDVPVWRFDADDEDALRDWQDWAAAASALDHLVFNTQVAEDAWPDAMDRFDLASGPDTSVVYYGIDTTTPTLLSDEDHGPDERVVGTVSRPEWYKGYDTCLHAFADLSDVLNALYVVVGQGRDLGRVHRMATLLDVDVRLAGKVNDVEKWAFLNVLDVGLYLGFNQYVGSLFPLEALYAGAPVIVADTPVMQERLPDNGVWWVDPGDAHAATSMLERLLLDEGVAVEAVKRQVPKARDWIRENRSTSSHANGLMATLQEVA